MSTDEIMQNQKVKKLIPEVSTKSNSILNDNDNKQTSLLHPTSTENNKGQDSTINKDSDNVDKEKLHEQVRTFIYTQ